MFLIWQQVDGSLEGPHSMEKNIMIQTQSKPFSGSHAPTSILDYFAVQGSKVQMESWGRGLGGKVK